MQQENSSCLNREIRTKKLAEKRPAKNGFASSEAGLFLFPANIQIWMRPVFRIAFNFMC